MVRPQASQWSDVDPRSNRPVDLLEVYCFETPQLTHQVNRFGGKALRFTRKDGDLSTPDGVNKLWTWVKMYEPKHIWASPDCKAWGGFSRLNMTRSDDLEKKILFMRILEKKHFTLCSDLYWYQVTKGNHFHLEQPLGSELKSQGEVADLMFGTLQATFDLCRVGRLKLPDSGIFFGRGQQYTRPPEHYIIRHFTEDLAHAITNIRPLKAVSRQNISSFAAAYTATFARTIAKALLTATYKREEPYVCGADCGNRGVIGDSFRVVGAGVLRHVDILIHHSDQ